MGDRHIPEPATADDLNYPYVLPHKRIRLIEEAMLLGWGHKQAWIPARAVEEYLDSIVYDYLAKEQNG